MVTKIDVYGTTYTLDGETQVEATIRQGDVALVRVKEKPTDMSINLYKNPLVYLEGDNNDHYVDKGEIVIFKNPVTLQTEDYVYGYIIANDTTIFHNEHNPKSEIKQAKLKDGIYLLFKQKEKTPDGLALPISD